MLGFQMGIAPQHFPVLVAGYESNMFNRKADFEQAAGAFMAKVMKVKVEDFQFLALSTEGRAH